ncbi:MAG: hypothetical protein KKB70_06805 [Proteobacteria bacterium]|nr:hypothetical protein [Pseudomonadota bacterium]
MNRLFTRIVFASLALAMLVAAGCAPHALPPMERPEGTLAVAGFTNPKYNWQLLAGYIPAEGREMELEKLMELDQMAEATLTNHGIQDYAAPAQTRRCQEIVTFQNEGGRISALKYWTSVGKCMKVDWLLVPQVLSWQDRQGEEWGAVQPAGVSLDFYYIDVAAGEVRVRKHYEETQRSLSEDLGNAGTFFDRGGKWVSAMQLAQEAIEIKFTELGL